MFLFAAKSFLSLICPFTWSSLRAIFMKGLALGCKSILSSSASSVPIIKTTKS